MLIRMRADKVILSFLLLAGIGCSIAEDGYQYGRPTIGFSDGFKNVGAPSQQVVAAPSTVRPAVAFGGFSQSGQQQQVKVTPKPQTSFGGSQGFGQSIVQKPAVTTTTFSQFGQQAAKPAGGSGQYQQSQNVFQGAKPVIATNFGGFQGFGQSVQKPAAATGQYKAPVVDTLKLQTAFEGLQKPSITRPQTSFGQTTFGQVGQQQTVVQPKQVPRIVGGGQYPKPLVSLQKPEVSYLPPQSQSQTTTKVTVSKPQVTFQGFTSSAGTPKPAIVRPQANFGGLQGYSQSSKQKPAFATVQPQKPSTPSVARPQVASFGGFQSQSAIQKPAVVTGQYQKPIVPQQKPQSSYLPPKSQTSTLTVNKPQVAFQGFTSSAASKPQTGFGGFQSQSTVQKPAVVTGQYQKPIVPQQKPQSSYLPPKSQTSTLTVNKPQVAFQGFTSSAASKPQTGFGGFQSQSTVQKPAAGQYQKPATLTVSKPQVAFQGFTSSAGTKPQTGFGGFQSQSTVEKPAVVTGQYQKPIVPQQKPQSSYLPPKSQTSTLTVNKPQVAFQGFTSSAASKPQTGFGGFQSQSTVQKPAVVTGQYQKPATLTVAKPQVAFQGFTSSAGTKPQTGFGGFQSQSAIQKPAVVTGQYQKPATLTVAKPQVAFTSSASAKPTFSQFGQVPEQQVADAGQYQKPSQKPELSYLPPKSQTSTLTVSKPQVSFQGFTSSAATPKPVVATLRPQTGFSGQYQGSQTLTASKPQATFQGFSSAAASKPQTSFDRFQSQSTVQKPAAGQYQKPIVSQQKPQSSYLPPKSQTSTLTVNKPQVAFQGFTSSAASKPQTGFGGFQSQSTVQKPAAGQYQKPATLTVAKPQVAFQGFTSSAASKPQTGFGGFQSQSTVQKPAVVTGQYQKPATLTVAKPQVAFQGFTSSAGTKPQTGFGGFQSQSTVQKPSVVTGQYQKPATLTVSKPQAAFQGFTSSASPKPVIATAKPQTSFGGFQSIGQSVVQKPAVTTTAFSQFGQVPAQQVADAGQYQKPSQKPELSYLPPKSQTSTLTVSKPQVSFQGFTSSAATPKPVVATVRPQTGFSGQYQGSQTLTASKPQATFQGFSSAAASKPQTGFSGFQSVSQATVQKPAVITGQYQKPATLTVTKPQVAFQGFSNSAASKPQTGFSGFQRVSPTFVQKPAVTTTTFSEFGQQPAKSALSAGQYQSTSTSAKPLASVASAVSSKYSQPQVSSQKVNLEYLPPVGAAVPKNIVKSSGAPSNSVFELSSTTANQVVDAAPEQQVAGFLADENIEPARAYSSLRSGLPSSVAQLVFSAAQEQKVETLSTLIDPHFGAQKYTPTTRQSAFEFSAATPSQTINQNAAGSISTSSFSSPQSSVSQIGTNEVTDQLDLNGQYGQVQSQTISSVPSQQVVSHQLGGVQSQTSHVVPSQEVVKTQLTVLDRGQASVEGSYQVGQAEATGRSLNIDQSGSSSNHYDVAHSQVQEDSPVQNPQPLNQDEQQARRLQEKADSDKEEHVVKSLQPGSHIGPHVNKDSDKEYNVFDYDQFSADPDETEI